MVKYKVNIVIYIYVFIYYIVILLKPVNLTTNSITGYPHIEVDAGHCISI